MCERLRDASFDGFAAPLYFAHEHRALDRRDAKVTHALWVGLLGQLSLGLFFDEECRQLVLITSKMRLTSWRISSSFTVASFPRVPNGQPRVIS
jgi:hypothetical protein